MLKKNMIHATTNDFSKDRHEWLMDVMSDLRKYAQINHLPALADQLENALLICAVEMENCPSNKKIMMNVA